MADKGYDTKTPYGRLLPESTTGRNTKMAEANMNWERPMMEEPMTHPAGNPEPSHVKDMGGSQKHVK